MSSILVIDASPSVRETLGIVLGHEHDVVALSDADEAAPAGVEPALAILGLGPDARDNRRIGVALERMAPAAPLLILNAAGDVDLRALAEPSRRVAFLPKPFDAYALRTQVAALLTGGPARASVLAPATRHRRRLEYPFLSRSAAVIARQATQADLPVLLMGERGTGALEVVRALHFFAGGRGRLVVRAARDLRPDDLRSATAGGDVGTLFLDDVHELSTAVQHELLVLLQDHRPGDATGEIRVLAATGADLETAVARGTFSAELAFTLAAIPIRLPPLRERGDDLPDLVATLSAETTARIGLAPVDYTDAALARLQRYLWFGNVAELAAVLGRTLALRRPRLVDASDLVFLPAHAADAVTSRTTPQPARRAAAADGALATPNLEILLGELAHELRNPMVTIKTFAQHLDSLLQDPEGRARFARLTAEAIGRMDTLLETLLDFARFRAPVPVATDLGSLLEQALAEHADELRRKSVRIERNGSAPGQVQVDAAQVLFALRSLVGGLVGDLVPHEPLRVTAPDAGALEMHAHAAPTTAARLATFVEGGEQTLGVETPTLPFAIAAALLARNGGRLSVRSGEAGTTVITVAMAPAG
jgi:DNA-binding NtrC family response regulator